MLFNSDISRKAVACAQQNTLNLVKSTSNNLVTSETTSDVIPDVVIE